MISDPLNGMFWDIGIDFQIPYFGDTEKVAFVFKNVKRRTAKATKRTIFKPPRSKKLVFLQ